MPDRYEIGGRNKGRENVSPAGGGYSALALELAGCAMLQ